MRLSNVALTKIGEKSGEAYNFLRKLGHVHLTIALIVVVFGLLGSDPATIASGAVLFALPVATVILVTLANKLCRTRTIGGVEYSPEDYAVIADVLRERGITNAERFMNDNSEHQAAWKDIYSFVGRGDYEGINTWEEIRAFQSLVYYTEMAPHQAVDAIKSIVAERKVTDINAARELLRDYKSVGSPLGSGAL